MKIKEICAMFLSMVVAVGGHVYANDPEDRSLATIPCCRSEGSDIDMCTIFDSSFFINGKKVTVKISRTLTHKPYSGCIETDDTETLSKFLEIDKTAFNKTFYDEKTAGLDYVFKYTVKKLKELPIA